MLTSAASGISTTALRKKVVKPKVKPKTRQHAGLHEGPVPAASRAAIERSPQACCGESPGCHTTSSGLAVRDSSAAKRCVSTPMSETPRISSCSGVSVEPSGELLGHIPVAQLGADLQAVHGLRLGARIQQGPHGRPGGAASPARQDAHVYGLGGHMAQQACGTPPGSRAAPVRRASGSARAPGEGARGGSSSTASAPCCNSHCTVCTAPGSVLITATPAKGSGGGVGCSLLQGWLDAGAHAGLHAVASCTSSGSSLIACACGALVAQAVKLDSGVASTCRRRTPRVTVCPAPTG